MYKTARDRLPHLRASGDEEKTKDDANGDVIYYVKVDDYCLNKHPQDGVQ